MRPEKLPRIAAVEANLFGLDTNALDVLGFQSFVARHNVKADFLPFIQGLEAGTHDGRVVNENVLAGILGDEPEPLFVIEPLYFAASHMISPGLWV
jgi:hypothetical protein